MTVGGDVSSIPPIDQPFYPRIGMTTVKYLRALINLGEEPLEVFQEPTGNYVLSQAQVFSASDFDPKNLPRFLRSRGLDSLPCMQLNLPRFSIAGGKVKPLTIEQASVIWAELASMGNQKAKALLIACAAESIERRADAAFGVQRSEEERNSRFEARVKGILTRRELTDSIRDYLNRVNASESSRTWIYTNATNAMYRSVFGMSATELESFLCCARNQSRNFLDINSLRAVEFAENLICRMIDDRQMEPMEAVRYSIEIASIKVKPPAAKQSSATV